MDTLIPSDDLRRVEAMLLNRRDELVKATSWTFNLVLLALVVGTFLYFLYVQYNSEIVEQEENKRIPFTPVTWYSATRNVRNEEYGAIAETQAGFGVPQPLGGGGTETLWGSP